MSNHDPEAIIVDPNLSPTLTPDIPSPNWSTVTRISVSPEVRAVPATSTIHPTPTVAAITPPTQQPGATESDLTTLPHFTDIPVSPTLSADILTPTAWPTVTKQVLPDHIADGLEPCSRRALLDDPRIFVSQQFGLPESYVPPDLVPLSDYFSSSVTITLNNQVRLSIIEPLRQIIDAMHGAGLKPSIISGYRSYGEQYLAWKWWNSQYPERVAIMSARPGHSEHQLGTTVDFGSPALNHLFHVDFANTPEGIWLHENAHLYGFVMSYPPNTYEITGFKYEPWHYRYVGVDLSMQLHTTGQTLTTWQIENLPPPCVP